MIKDCCYAQSESRTKRNQGGSGLRSKGRSLKALLRVFVVSNHGHLAWAKSAIGEKTSCFSPSTSMIFFDSTAESEANNNKLKYRALANQFDPERI
jgi:hypothetical protein